MRVRVRMRNTKGQARAGDKQRREVVSKIVSCGRTKSVDPKTQHKVNAENEKKRATNNMCTVC